MRLEILDAEFNSARNPLNRAGLRHVKDVGSKILACVKRSLLWYLGANSSSCHHMGETQ